MVRLSVEEIVSTVKHTSLPTVFVEGPDDMFVFTRVEQRLGSLKANFLPCGDKPTLLKVFLRRQEFLNVPTCFVADKDMWLFSGVPEEFVDLITTSGYSIENDLYVDSKIERILDSEEKRSHLTLIAGVCRWFACEVDKFNKGLGFCADPKLARLVPIPGVACSPDYLTEIGFYEPPPELVSQIQNNYTLSLRGKLLYEIIVRFTHTPDRPGGKYGYSTLMELSVVDGLNGPTTSKIIEAIRRNLGLPMEPQQELPLGSGPAAENPLGNS